MKYPRTLHLPWSPGVTSDDKVLESIDFFHNKKVVVTEKLDGENTGMTSQLCHARSLESKHHPSRSWVKQLHATIKCNLSENLKLFGENVYAKHSVHYSKLTTYFYLFAVYDGDICLSWDEVCEFAALLDLQTVPVLYRGPWDEDRVKACWTGQSNFGTEQEGYVVRFDDQFRYEDHAKCVAKYVRANHVQTSTHWMQEEVVPNEVI